nr:MAG TPA: hypothetical protein [Caudoviricetes sp.]
MPVMPGSPFDKGCYGIVKAYHVTRVFSVRVGGDTPGCCGRF